MLCARLSVPLGGKVATLSPGSGVPLGVPVFFGQAIVTFANQKLEPLGLSVQNLDTQVRTRLWGPRAGSGRGVQQGAGSPVWPGGSSAPTGVGEVSLVGSIADQGHCGDPVRWGPWGLCKGVHCAISTFIVKSPLFSSLVQN